MLRGEFGEVHSVVCLFALFSCLNPDQITGDMARFPS